MTTSLKESSRVDTERANLPDDRFDGSLSVFLTVALILLLWGFCWLKNNTSMRPPQMVTVAFHEIAGLSKDAGVYVDGVRVGIVDNISWQSSRNVHVLVRINSDRVVIPVGAKFSILTNGIVGAKYVEIGLPSSREPLPAVSAREVVLGEDPVRPELAVNKLAIAMSEIDFHNLRQNLEEDHHRIIKTTDQLAHLVERTIPLIDRTLPLEEKALALCTNMEKVSAKLSKLMDDPNVSRDLKETVTQLRETMAHVREVMSTLNLTLADPALRKDIVDTMDKLNKATTSVQESMEVVRSISADKELCGDVKQMLRDARSAMTKVDRLVSDPTFGTDLKGTLKESREAIEHIDLAAQQMNQMLDKRFPLVHMLVGRPGRVEKKNADKKLVERSKTEVEPEPEIQPDIKPEVSGREH